MSRGHIALVMARGRLASHCRGHIALLLLAVAFFSTSSSSLSCDPAPACDETLCAAPDCHCSGDETDIPFADRPQIVYLTYYDGLSAYTESNFYRSLFNGSLTNPDGCPIRATHLISAMYTDYTLVNMYRNLGHEMASHSITHRINTTYWENLDEEGQKKEFYGMKQMIAQFANVPVEEIIGVRSPWGPEGEPYFTMMQNNGFEYDSSMPTVEYGYINADKGLYPYTLDYKSIQDCKHPKCSYPGLWVQPIIALEDNWPLPCLMLDACIGFEKNTPEEITEFLWKNFRRVYEGNRAPWGLHMHPAWFYGAYEATHYVGYKNFLKEILELDNVWIVPIRDGIEYMKNPKKNTEIVAMGQHSVFGCARYNQHGWNRNCGRILNCRFGDINNEDIHHVEMYMKICTEVDGDQQDCPPNYPWLGDPCGGNDPCNG